MSDSIQNVNSITPVEPSAAAAQLYQVYQSYLQKVSTTTVKSNQTASANTNMDGKMEIPYMDPTKVDAESSKQISKIAPNLVRDSLLKFQVNAETNEVTVMIVDKATQKVINTIPPEAIKDIPAGDLLQYSA